MGVLVARIDSLYDGGTLNVECSGFNRLTRQIVILPLLHAIVQLGRYNLDLAGTLHKYVTIDLLDILLCFQCSTSSWSIEVGEDVLSGS